MTNVDSLKALYVGLGGEAEAVADANDSVEVLNAIAKKYGGKEAETNAEAVANIAAVADNIGTKIERVFLWDTLYDFNYDLQEVDFSLPSYEDLNRYDGLTAFVQFDGEIYETKARYSTEDDTLSVNDMFREIPIRFFVKHNKIFVGSQHSGTHVFGVKVVDNKVEGRQLLSQYESTYIVSMFETARIAEPVTNSVSVNISDGGGQPVNVVDATILGPYLEQNVFSYETSYIVGYFDRKIFNGDDVCVNVCTFAIPGEVTNLRAESYAPDYEAAHEAFASFKYNSNYNKTYCSITIVFHDARYHQGNWGANVIVEVTMAGGNA